MSTFDTKVAEVDAFFRRFPRWRRQYQALAENNVIADELGESKIIADEDLMHDVLTPALDAAVEKIRERELKRGHPDSRKKKAGAG